MIIFDGGWAILGTLEWLIDSLIIKEKLEIIFRVFLGFMCEPCVTDYIVVLVLVLLLVSLRVLLFFLGSQ